MKLPHISISSHRHALLLLAAMGLFSLLAANAATYSETVKADNPVGYWRFEEPSGSGIAEDSSASGAYPGYYTGSPTFELPGIDTRSISMQAPPNPTSPVTVGYYPDLNLAGAFSFEIWVRPNSAGTSGEYRCPIGNFGGWGNPSGWYVYQTPSPGSTFTLLWQPANAFVGGFSYELFKWYHLVGTYDGTTARFYVNGQLQSSAPFTYGVGYVANPGLALGLGERGDGYGWWDGNLDEAAVYTNALSPEQVLTHYTVGTNSFYTPPQAPTFTLQPVSKTNYAGTVVQFSALADGYPTTMSYQWYQGTSPIQDETNATYSFTCTLADDQKTFKVTASNGVNPPATSSEAALTVLTNLDIYVQPTSITRTEGTHSKAAFITLAHGALPLTYQWFKGTSQIPGATNPTLWLSGLSVATDDGSTYYCKVTTPYGTADSAPATLTVQTRAVSVPIDNYAKVVVEDDPVAYWRLDEPDGSGIATDAVGSFDATYEPGAGTITYGVPTGIPHETNTAVNLTNSPASTTQGATVRIPYALELNSFGPFSVECWLQPSRQAADGNDYRTPISSQRSGDGPIGWHVYQDPSDTFIWVLWNGHWSQTWIAAAMAPAVANNWYHLVLTYNGANFVIYVNGVAGGSGTDSAFVQVGNRPAGDDPGPYPYTYDGAGETVFGWRADGDWKLYAGAVDDVAVYNKALTAEQVKLHYANTVKLTISRIGNDVVLSWPFGTLQSAPAATGTYTNVPSATSPLTNSPSQSVQFYRVQVQ